MHDRPTTLLPKATLFAAAAMLLASMAMHEFLPHEHQHFAFGEGVFAAMHGQDRRNWFAALLAGLVPTGLLVAVVLAFGVAAARAAMTDGVPHHLHEAFKRGILHPKICG